MLKFNNYRLIRTRENDLFVTVHKPHVIKNHYVRHNNDYPVDVYPTFDTYEMAKDYYPNGIVYRVVTSIQGDPVCDMVFPLRYVSVPEDMSAYDVKNVCRASYCDFVRTNYNMRLLGLMSKKHKELTGRHWESHVTSKFCKF